MVGIGCGRFYVRMKQGCYEMRCMTLAITFSALGWIALATQLKSEETLQSENSSADLITIDLSSSTSSRQTHVALASNSSTPEIASPSDFSPPQGSPNRSQNPIQGQDLSAFHGYHPPLPFGPSRTQSILQYMTCDPHSCPSIWQGYEAQRAADLAKKCSPPGGAHCGSGCGCGRSNLHSSPCVSCAGPMLKPLNRYRPSTVSKASCDAISTPASYPNSDCPSCNTGNTSNDTKRLSEGEPTALAR